MMSVFILQWWEWLSIVIEGRLNYGKKQIFQKAAVAGLATVMTVAGSVMAFANNTTMYVGDDSVRL